MIINNIFLLTISIILLFATQASGASQYNIIDLGTLGGNWSEATGINNSGEVVGYSSPGSTYQAISHAFTYTLDGGIKDLTPSHASSYAYGINDKGEVVGTTSDSPNLPNHAFSYTKDNGIVNIDTIGRYSVAYGVNNNGEVVGTSLYKNQSDNIPHAFHYTSSGGMSIIVSGLRSYAQGINDNGEIVGSLATPGDTAYHAFTYTQDSGITYLNTISGENNYAYGINNNGEIVGSSNFIGGASNEVHAFSFTVSSGITDLGTLGGKVSEARGINNKRKVVGVSTTLGGVNHAFIYTENIGMIDLNTLISPDSGWVLQRAIAINDNDQIVGNGIINGQSHAFLMISTTSVPEPTSMWLIASGFIGFIFIIKYRNRHLKQFSLM